MGIPLVEGREFTRADNETAPLVAVVNEFMAAKYWRGRSPVGSRLQVKGRWMQVVGIAKLSKYRNLAEARKPFFYVAMREQVDRTTAVQRVAVTMLGVFGGLALLLAAIGLYGVMSYTVSQRTRELGLRMALGASTSNLLGLVLSHGLALTAGGVVLGAAAALSLTRLMGSLLYNVSPRDPLAFGSALVVMAIAALSACLLPAWRAARTDPVRALRQ
jgi:ABC-type antimicrobial peptide transport system permease subunit